MFVQIMAVIDNGRAFGWDKWSIEIMSVNLSKKDLAKSPIINGRYRFCACSQFRMNFSKIKQLRVWLHITAIITTDRYLVHNGQ